MNTVKKSFRKNVPFEQSASLIVMTVNPSSLHAYWQVPDRINENIRKTLGKSLADARPVLRFYDITSILFDETNAHQVFDVEIDLRAMSWNIPIWCADKSYLVDLGYRTADGRFHQIARSNFVGVPRDTPSARTVESYKRIERGQIRDVSPAKPDPIQYRNRMSSLRPETTNPAQTQKRNIPEGKVGPAEAVPPDRKKDKKTVTSVSRFQDTVEDRGRFNNISCPIDLIWYTEKNFLSSISSQESVKKAI